jgi:hypothetical protein
MKKITRMVTCRTMDAMDEPTASGKPQVHKSEALETQTGESVTRCTIRYWLHPHPLFCSQFTRHNTPWQER